MAEDKALSTLLMDRSEPLGNSEDTFARRALHTKVGNKLTEPVPVFNVSGLTPSMANYPILATTELPIPLPANCSSILIKPRLNARMRVSLVLGETATNYVSVPLGGYFVENSLNSISTIYVWCSRLTDLEVIFYTKI